MNIHTNIERPYWVVISKNKTHYGKLVEGQELTTVNEIITFVEEQEWKDFLETKGINIDNEINQKIINNRINTTLE